MLVAAVVRQPCSVVDCLVMRCGRGLVCCHEVTKWLPFSGWGGAGWLSWGWLFLVFPEGRGVTEVKVKDVYTVGTGPDTANEPPEGAS